MRAAPARSFYLSLQAPFDIAFAEVSDRDAGYYQYQVGDGGAAWWDAADYAGMARYLAGFVSAAGKRVVLWQQRQWSC